MITVYYVETEYPHNGWSDTFLELVLHLRDKPDVNIVHQFGGAMYIPEYDYTMPDCEIIIYDSSTDILRAITWSESPTRLLKIFTDRDNPKDVMLLTQQAYWFAPDYDYGKHKFTIKPTTFYTFTPQTNHNHFYNLRRWKSFDKLIDQLFFLSSTRREDPFALREMGMCSPVPGNLNIDNYLSLAINYKVGLSISSTAEMCYRDIEYMAIGLPMLRLEYMTELYPKLIPNYHYISIPRDGFDWSTNSDRAGGQKYIDAYVKRFLEVKDDKEFLDFIVKNAREYYETNCSPQNKLKYILNRLEIE